MVWVSWHGETRAVCWCIFLSGRLIWKYPLLLPNISWNAFPPPTYPVCVCKRTRRRWVSSICQSWSLVRDIFSAAAYGIFHFFEQFALRKKNLKHAIRCQNVVTFVKDTCSMIIRCKSRKSHVSKNGNATRPKQFVEIWTHRICSCIFVKGPWRKLRRARFFKSELQMAKVK